MDHDRELQITREASTTMIFLLTIFGIATIYSITQKWHLITVILTIIDIACITGVISTTKELRKLLRE